MKFGILQFTPSAVGENRNTQKKAMQAQEERATLTYSSRCEETVQNTEPPIHPETLISCGKSWYQIQMDLLQSPEIVFPALESFAQQAQHKCLLVWEKTKTEVFSWTGILPPNLALPELEFILKKCYNLPCVVQVGRSSWSVESKYDLHIPLKIVPLLVIFWPV